MKELWQESLLLWHVFNEAFRRLSQRRHLQGGRWHKQKRKMRRQRWHCETRWWGGPGLASPTSCTLGFFGLKLLVWKGEQHAGISERWERVWTWASTRQRQPFMLTSKDKSLGSKNTAGERRELWKRKVTGPVLAREALFQLWICQSSVCVEHCDRWMSLLKFTSIHKHKEDRKMFSFSYSH